MKHLAAIVTLVILLAGCTTTDISKPNKKIAGTYSWVVPGSTWVLRLNPSGNYTIVHTGHDGWIKLLESGTWKFEDFSLRLNSEQEPSSGDYSYRNLSIIQGKSGERILVSPIRFEGYIGDPLPDEVLFWYFFIEGEGLAREKNQNQP